MTFSKEYQKITLVSLIAIIVLLNGYRFFAGETQQTAPLVYPRGAVAKSPVRHGLEARSGGADILNIFIERSQEPYPGTVRDIFRMERPAAKPGAKPMPVVIVTAPTPSAPARTEQEIAADLVRADLLKFRYLGYLAEKDMTLFLSKDGELFIVKSGDKVLSHYTIKEVNKDYVVILDIATRIEGRVPLSGGETQVQQQQQQQLQPLSTRQWLSQPGQLPKQPTEQPAEMTKEQLKQQAIDRRRHRSISPPPP